MASILPELKQTRPFASKGLEAGVALMRTASMLHRRLESEMVAHGITAHQFNVLRILRGAESALPTMEISNRMIDPEPGITRLLGRLETKGLITRSRCAQDGRRILAAITSDGIQVLNRIGEPTDYLADAPKDGMSEQEIDQFLTLLGKARRALAPATN